MISSAGNGNVAFAGASVGNENQATVTQIGIE